MNLHPAVVHFPIGLLMTYSVLEVLTIRAKRKEWHFVKAILVILGTLGAIAGLITGDMAAGDSRDKFIEMHELFAQTSFFLYLIVAIGYSLSLFKKISVSLERVRDFILRIPVRVTFAILGAIALTITGAIGGIMVYGPTTDPMTQLVYNILFA